MRLRREEPLDPAVERELEAIDIALRADPVDPDLAELGRLAFELRAERPVPEREFAAELDRRLHAGFLAAADKQAPSDGRQRARRPRLALAFGGAAAVFIAVTAVISSGVLESTSVTPKSGRVEERQTGRDLSAGAGSQDSARSAPEALSVSPPAPRRQGLVPGVRRREVERQVSLTLAAPRGEIERVADDVIAVTDRYRGFVLSSTVSGGDRREEASIELRIPAARLQPALADLSELAHVRSRTQASEDVTAAVSSLRSRLRDAHAERSSLLRRLERATTDGESAAIRARMRIVSRRIARTRSSFRAQRNRVDYAAVAVAVEVDARSGKDGSWTPGDALDDARGILGTTVGIAVVTIAVVLPASLLVLLGWAGWRQARGRLRERALDSTSN